MKTMLANMLASTTVTGYARNAKIHASAGSQARQPPLSNRQNKQLIFFDMAKPNRILNRR
ncbi:MAG TPA: hypothetical protein VMV48_03805 [Gallionellaceae bacterium]|nr:hypothetical protein [Gallionellaceae bacterium]